MWRLRGFLRLCAHLQTSRGLGLMARSLLALLVVLTEIPRGTLPSAASSLPTSWSGDSVLGAVQHALGVGGIVQSGERPLRLRAVGDGTYSRAVVESEGLAPTLAVEKALSVPAAVTPAASLSRLSLVRKQTPVQLDGVLRQHQQQQEKEQQLEASFQTVISDAQARVAVGGALEQDDGRGTMSGEVFLSTRLSSWNAVRGVERVLVLLLCTLARVLTWRRHGSVH